jgi:hypothetical protein
MRIVRGEFPSRLAAHFATRFCAIAARFRIPESEIRILFDGREQNPDERPDLACEYSVETKTGNRQFEVVLSPTGSPESTALLRRSILLDVTKTWTVQALRSHCLGPISELLHTAEISASGRPLSDPLSLDLLAPFSLLRLLCAARLFSALFRFRRRTGLFDSRDSRHKGP